jgi:hypothetical protein
MIKKQSDDPNVEDAAQDAFNIIKDLLSTLPKANTLDYGGQELKIGEYEVCVTCTSAIAEAQQAQKALEAQAETIEDPVVKEHLLVAAHLFEREADAAIVRAELHNGFGTEKILNLLLGFQYERSIHDDYQHSHQQGA